MSKRFWFVLCLGMVCVLLSQTFLSSLAWAKDEVKLGTGLLQPSSEQADWLKKNVPQIQRFRLNSIALQRINAERQARGLRQFSASDLDVAPLGQEAVLSSTSTSSVQTNTLGALATALPGSIDNSASPAFPPIRSQGNIGSCACWAATYYQMTYETNLALGRTASGGDNTVIFSPKWSYNMINRGGDNGSSFADALALETKNGAATWADFPYDSNYLEWCMNPAAWSKAINYRSLSWGQISAPDADSSITNIKTQLANGHVVTIGTYVLSWVQSTIGNDPSTTADDAFAGQYIATYAKNGNSGGHGMTIVGYNDNIWCDLNHNGQVDPGEKGAFKIANSWGTADWNQGFRWITYDSLRAISAVPATATWPTNDRSSFGIFIPGNIFTLAAYSSYTPTYKAAVTLNSAPRGQLSITLGIGNTSTNSPTTTWSSKAISNSGGNCAFNGTMTACDGTFYFDFTDLTKSISGAKRWFVGVLDNTAGNPSIIKTFNLYQVTPSGEALVATATGLPKTVDAAQAYTWVDYTIGGPVNQLPVAAFTASPTSGTVPLAVSFNGTSSYDPDGQIAAYAWNFGDGSIGTGPAINHTYSATGQFTATLTVTDNKGATGSKSVTITTTGTINHPPVISPIGNQTVYEGSLLQFTVSAADADNDPLTYSASTLPSGAGFSTSTHVFSWRPASGQAGTYYVTFQVTDGKASTSQTITITVNRVTPTTGQISGTVKDASSGLFINGASVSNGRTSITTASNGSYTFTNLSAGNYTVTATATGYQSSSMVVTVTAGLTSTANFSLQKVAIKSMWVNNITFTPTGNNLNVTVNVVNPQPVNGAQVSLNLRFNSYMLSVTKPTNSAGNVTFTLSPAYYATYTATVTNLSLSGYRGIRPKESFLRPSRSPPDQNRFSLS